MQTTEAFVGLRPLDGDERIDANSNRATSERGLTPIYNEKRLATAHNQLFDRDTDAAPGPDAGLGRFAPVLPFPPESLVTLGEGSTPLVECPTYTDSWGVDVLLKDEGRNPTGSIVDREMALAVTAAREQGASDVVLPTTGNGGQAAAAYAARASLGSRAFVPSRSTFDTKAMTNVHGGEMDVIGGRYPDALAAFEERSDGAHSLAPFETPYRHEGVKTLAYELAAIKPDAVVLPVSHGNWLVGLYRGFAELVSTDTIPKLPRLYAVQPAGCAPIVEGHENGGKIEPVAYPDTICGTLEVPNPAGGTYAVDVLEATDGGAVAVSDDALLDAALETTRSGIPVSATGGTAIAGGAALADTGVFDTDTRVVLVDPTTANRETDLLRSRLMAEGV